MSECVLIRHASRSGQIFIRLSIISWALTRTLTQFRYPSVIALARRRLTYGLRADTQHAYCAKISRGTPAKTDLRERRESTVLRIKFMLREATVIAEEHFFPFVRNGCDATAIVRNTSKHKKFYEVIVISANNTKVCQRMRLQRTLRNGCVCVTSYY